MLTISINCKQKKKDNSLKQVNDNWMLTIASNYCKQLKASKGQNGQFTS